CCSRQSDPRRLTGGRHCPYDGFLCASIVAAQGIKSKRSKIQKWRNPMVSRSQILSRKARPPKRSALSLSIASALAAGVLTCASADARVVSVQMSAPTIAFGGYSWPGVGQYEKITGVAYAEIDPGDPRNTVIVDIGLAQPQSAPGQPGKTASGKV